MVAVFQVLLPMEGLVLQGMGHFQKRWGTLVTPGSYTLQPEIAISEGVTEINVSADG